VRWPRLPQGRGSPHRTENLAEGWRERVQVDQVQLRDRFAGLAHPLHAGGDRRVRGAPAEKQHLASPPGSSASTGGRPFAMPAIFAREHGSSHRGSRARRRPFRYRPASRARRYGARGPACRESPTPRERVGSRMNGQKAGPRRCRSRSARSRTPRRCPAATRRREGAKVRSRWRGIRRRAGRPVSCT